MFERYTEKARRVIFFARYEASQFGAPAIEAEHILLGLMREDKPLINNFFRTPLTSIESIRREIEARTPVREKVSTSVDLPVSAEGKRVMAYAAEESEQLQHRHIGTEHLLLGLLREEKGVAAELLREHGLRINQVRDELMRGATEERSKPITLTDRLTKILDEFKTLANLITSKSYIGKEIIDEITKKSQVIVEESLLKIIIREDLLTLEQIKDVLEHQRTNGGRFGWIIDKFGYLTEEKLIALLAREYNAPAIDLKKIEIDQSVIDLISREAAEKFLVLPIARVEQRLTLAMADPANIFAIKEIEKIAGLTVAPVVASITAIEKAIEKYYRWNDKPQSAAPSLSATVAVASAQEEKRSDMAKQSKFLSGKRIDPAPITAATTLADLVENNFVSYNAGRLREACQLFVEKMLAEDVTVGVSITGALTPAGLGLSALIPLIENGFIDWIISTGANLYHDTHFGIGLNLHRGTPNINDVTLREEGVVRIYDIFFDYNVLLSTDAFFREIITAPEFQHDMSTAEFHHLAGKYVREREKALGVGTKSLISAAYQLGVPIYTSSPGDSSIGMNVAAKRLDGNKLNFDVCLDVNETASIVLDAKRGGGKSAVFILGGGSPKNFLLQTEPQIQEVLGISEKGHDYFLQITDARADTGGLSGATPAEAVSWGKVDPDRLPDAVVCYVDSTIALPIITAYALARHKPRPLKRLFDRREEMLNRLRSEYEAAKG